jgi:DNA-binding transcriptional LysR family regulator
MHQAQTCFFFYDSCSPKIDDRRREKEGARLVAFTEGRMIYLDPYLLRAFMLVADSGTVSRAAAVLNRTQAAVSMQIRKLESLVGRELFVRSSKGLDLTTDGLLLIPFAREILTLNDQAVQRLNGKQMAGRVRLGVVEDFAATRLIDMLASFRAQNPTVHIDIIVESNKRLAAMFENDVLDVVVCDTTSVHRNPIFTWNENLLWVVRADLAISANQSLPIIMFEDTCPWKERCVAALSGRNIRWSIVCDASTLVAMATAVRVGVGIGPMIASTIPEGCRSLDRGADFPGPVQISIGLYVRAQAPEEAQFLAEFVRRLSPVVRA